MRGIASSIAKIRHIAQAHKTTVSLCVAAVLVAVGVGVYLDKKAEVQAAGGDCSANSIIQCGIGSYRDLTAKYDQNAHGDLRAIMDHYWIKRAPEQGTRVVEGVANNRGEVVADGRVVASNAASIGRQAIAHSHRIVIAGKSYYQTTHVGGRAFKPGTTQLPTLVVLDQQGNFKYAVIKACGNPIYATPVPPPAPKQPPTPEPKQPPVPQPKPKKQSLVRCDALGVEQIDRTKFRFSVGYTAENATIKQVTFTIKDANGTVLQTHSSSNKTFVYTQDKAGTYTVEATIKAMVDGKEVVETSTNCKKEFTVAEEDKMTVCELATKNLNKVVTKKEFEADSKLPAAQRKYSANRADCETAPVTPKKEMCTVPGKEHLPKDSPDCQDVVASDKLPTTGPIDLLGAAIGLTSISVAAYYYAVSRRQ